MADKITTAKISCDGGLDLRSTIQELLSRPGAASELTNFEQSLGGGYRRINGYQRIGTADIPGTGKVLGCTVYNNGFVVCRESGIYFSFDGNDWIQINKNVPTLSAKATLDSAAALDRPFATKYTFDTYTHGSAGLRTDLLIHDGNNNCSVFTMIGSNILSAQYRYVELAVEGEFGIVNDDQHIVAGDSNAPSTFYVSSITNMEDFAGSLSGAYSVADPIVGLKSFRDIAYIFCENSIWKAQGLNTGSPVIEPVTRNIGCVSHYTIQEIGGDLMFLAPDGLRTLGATDRIDDVELSTVSLDINSELLDILRRVDSYEFSSTVIRNKNQYRLLIDNFTSTFDQGIGYIATFFPDNTTGKTWSFSKIKGIKAHSMGSGFIRGKEVLLHGGTDGVLNQHDIGNTFDQLPIEGVYQTPFFDLGDSGLRKALRNIILYFRSEGFAQLKMQLMYNYLNSNTHQPLEYDLASLNLPATYGLSTYGSAVYGSTTIPVERLHVQGSGKTIALRFRNSITTAPYTIQGFDIDFTVAGRI